ncbi:MAG TPA: TIM barrel protein [Syntrophomonadaceae bacterium]|nr:TIM barrel protein [Syntrophomonadaceae bacterium]
MHSRKVIKYGFASETMAGQGREIASTFDELNRILQNIKYADKIGVCYDTCHIFAAGFEKLLNHDFRANNKDYQKKGIC